MSSNLADENLPWMTTLISARSALITCPKQTVLFVGVLPSSFSFKMVISLH